MVKNWPKKSLDGISRVVDCEVHRPCRLGSLSRGEQPGKPHVGDAGRCYLKENGSGLGWATSTNGCDLKGFSFFFFLQVGFLDIKQT